MVEINLEFLAQQQKRILDELRVMREQQEATRFDLRRNSETLVGLSRVLDHMRDDLVSMLKAEIGGLFAHLETRLEHHINREIEARLNPRTDG